MKKNILMTLVLLTYLGCSEKEPTPKAPLKENVDVNKTVLETTTRTTSNATLSPDFIPEHIKHSHIEVVEHY